MPTDRIIEIKNKIRVGASLEDLQREYPITPALFQRLGGTIPRYVTVSHPFIHEIIGDGLIPDCNQELDRDLVIGTLMGDGNIHKYGRDTCVFSLVHSIDQASYIKMNYEMLRPFINRIKYVCDKDNHKSLHLFLCSLRFFSQLRNDFYTVVKADKKHLQKYLFRERIVDMMSLKSLAFWIMDDGKKYGTGKYMFSISIGKQPYYSYSSYAHFVGLLCDKFKISLRPREEKSSYEITPAIGKAEEIYEKIKDYVWPLFCYKFGASPDSCGGHYKNYQWYTDWSRSYGCPE